MPRNQSRAQVPPRSVAATASSSASSRSRRAASSQTILGSRRNHDSWRRAKDRVRRRIAARASSSVVAPRDVLEQLPVAERLTGGARQARRPCREAGDLVDETGGELGLEPGRDPAVELAAVERQPDEAEARRPVVAEARPRPAERPARAEDDLERPDESAAVRWFDPRRRRRVERDEAGVERGSPSGPSASPSSSAAISG